MDWAKNLDVRGDADPVMSALRDLVTRIEQSSYFDQYGHVLEADPVFIDARDIVRGYEKADT